MGDGIWCTPALALAAFLIAVAAVHPAAGETKLDSGAIFAPSPEKDVIEIIATSLQRALARPGAQNVLDHVAPIKWSEFGLIWLSGTHFGIRNPQVYLERIAPVGEDVTEMLAGYMGDGRTTLIDLGNDDAGRRIFLFHDYYGSAQYHHYMLLRLENGVWQITDWYEAFSPEPDIFSFPGRLAAADGYRTKLFQAAGRPVLIVEYNSMGSEFAHLAVPGAVPGKITLYIFDLRGIVPDRPIGRMTVDFVEQGDHTSLASSRSSRMGLPT